MHELHIKKSLLPYIEKAGVLYQFHPLQTIYFQEDISNNFYFIKKGRVRVYLVNQEGKELTIEIVGEGRVFGESSFFSQSARLTSVEAINEVELIACNIDDLMPYFQESPELVTSVFMLLSQTVKNLSHQVRRLCFLTAGERIADFLLEMTNHPHSSLEIEENCLPYTHEEIAKCISLQRVTVPRLLNEFQENKWILLKYRKVIILDKQALSDYAYKNI